MKDSKVAWIPTQDNDLTEIGVKAVNGTFIKGEFSFSDAVSVANQLSHETKHSAGKYIPVYIGE